MKRRKYISYLFQLVLLLFITKVAHTSYSITSEDQFKKTSFHLMDEESESSEEENKDKTEKDFDDDLFSIHLYTPIISSLNTLSRKEQHLQLTSSLDTIFTPPPELI